MSTPKVAAYVLTEHPKSCPHVTTRNSNKTNPCPGNLMDVPRKTGLPEVEGKWKVMCSVHGLVYYNLVPTEKSDA